MKKLTSDNRLYIIVAMIALLSIVGFLSYKFLFDKLSKPMIVGDFSVPVLRGWQEKEIPAIHMVQYRKAMENTQLVITFSRLRPSQAQVPQTIEELSSYEKESEQRSKALIPQLRAKYGTPVPRPNQEKWQEEKSSPTQTVSLHNIPALLSQQTLRGSAGRVIVKRRLRFIHGKAIYWLTMNITAAGATVPAKAVTESEQGWKAITEGLEPT